MSSDLPDARSPDDHVVFSTTIDVLFRKTLAPTITRDIEARLLKVGIDLSNPLEPGYPIRVFDDALEVVVTNGMPHLSKAEGLQRIGRLQVEAFLETLIGKATFAYLRLISRERFVNRLTQSWRQANNFIDTVVTARADGSMLIRINDVGRFPEVIQGILVAGFKAAGHTAEVAVRARDGIACEYEVRFP